jgi:tripartite-type tricarboxylate transporter receptor subunit TctC
MMNWRWPAAALAALAMLACGSIARAADDDYPSRPVTLVVTFPPGGGNDAMARLIAAKMSAALGRQFVVENRSGAGGSLGTRAVAKAVPDGYTLLLGFSGTMAINPSLYKNVGYDPQKDFAPIGLIASTPSVLVANPAFPAKTLPELIAYARQHPGEVNYASSGVGTVVHVSMEMFASMAGINIRHIPYKGTGPAVTDLLGNQVSLMMPPLQPVIGQITSGQLRAIGMASPERSSLLPNLPTIAESGVPGYTASMRYGLLAPAGTPAAVVAKLNTALNAALALDDVKARLATEGAEPLRSSPEEYRADLRRDEDYWAPVVKKLGLEVE